MRASLHASLVVQVSLYTIARVLLQQGLLALPRASCLYAHSRGTHSRGTQWPLPRMSPTQESGRSLGASASEPRRRGGCRLASARAQRRQDLRRCRTLSRATQRRGSQGQPLAALGGVGLVGRRVDGGGQQRVARVEAQRRAPALRRLLDLTGGAVGRGASAGMHLWCGAAMAAQLRLPAALGPNVPAWLRTNKRASFDPAPLCALRARPCAAHPPVPPPAAWPALRTPARGWCCRRGGSRWTRPQSYGCAPGEGLQEQGGLGGRQGCSGEPP